MAQAHSNVMTLRNIILSIPRYPTGSRPLDLIMRQAPLSEAIRSSRVLQEITEKGGDMLNQRLFDDVNKYFDSQPPFQLEDVLISGSLSEGTCKINFQELSSSDLDLMLILKNIKVTEADQRNGNLEQRDDSPFVNLYLSNELLIKTWTDFLETPRDSTVDRYLLSSKKLKLKLKENYEKIGHFFSEDVEEKAAKEVDDGPAIPLLTNMPDISEKIIHGINLTGSEELYDFVLAIKCDGWPLCAQEWFSRQRSWPAEELLTKIGEHFHIVCKSSLDGNFRLSFSNAERQLIENLGVLQHKVYRAFKSFINHYKKDWGPNIKNIFCSYHLKTIVLWHCEKTPSTDWSEETLVNHVLALIDDLVTALRKGQLPMYFMPKYNLLQGADDGKSVANKIESLRFNTSKIIQSIILEEFNIWGSSFEKSSLVETIKKQILDAHNTGAVNPSGLMDFVQHITKLTLGECESFWEDIVGSRPFPSDEAAISEGGKILNGNVQELCEELNSMLRSDKCHKS